IGQNGASLIRVVTGSGILESNPFLVRDRYLAFRLGGSTSGVALELRVPAASAATTGRNALYPPDADGFVAVLRTEPSGSDVLREMVWNLGANRAQRSLLGATAKVRLSVEVSGSRLLVDHIRQIPNAPPRFDPPLWGWADIHCHPMAQA